MLTLMYVFKFEMILNFSFFNVFSIFAEIELYFVIWHAGMWLEEEIWIVFRVDLGC